MAGLNMEDERKPAKSLREDAATYVYDAGSEGRHHRPRRGSDA